MAIELDLGARNVRERETCELEAGRGGSLRELVPGIGDHEYE